MKIKELLSEGYVKFTVMGSDYAADSFATVEDGLEKAESKFRKNELMPESGIQLQLCREAIKLLKKELNKKGNAYNTHGTLNVAMIVHQMFSQFRKFGEWKAFGLDVAKKLKQELTTSEYDEEYRDEMEFLANKLEKL